MHEVYLSGRLKTAIEKCRWLSKKQPFAWGNFTNLNYLPNEVTIECSESANVAVDDCRPHRLRDTFAVRKLLGGMSLDDPSKLILHSSVKVTVTYYARWSRRVRGR